MQIKEVIGVVEEALPGAMFRIKTQDQKEILGHLSGKMRIHRIRVLTGDRVLIEVSEYDETKGRIIKRL